MTKVTEKRKAVPKVTPDTRFIDIPKTKTTSIVGRKSITSEEVILEESKEFIIGENAGWVAANRLVKDFPVSEEDIALGELIDKAHYDPYASSIPKYVLEGTEDQHDAYGMGFDFGVSNALNAGLEATPIEAKPSSRRIKRSITKRPTIRITPKTPRLRR